MNKHKQNNYISNSEQIVETNKLAYNEYIKNKKHNFSIGNWIVFLDNKFFRESNSLSDALYNVHEHCYCTQYGIEQNNDLFIGSIDYTNKKTDNYLLNNFCK